MAWPCITRACCINRFWSELDKADIAVPLVFTKYSEHVADVHHQHHHHHQQQHHLSQPQHHPSEPPPETSGGVGGVGGGGGGAAAGDPPGGSASVTRQDFKAWNVRPEPSCKPSYEYHPSATPFDTETQYQKDYKPWPIPKKGDHPWIPKPSPPTTTTTKTTTTSSSSPGGRRGKKELQAAAEADSGVEKSEIEEKVQEKEVKEAAAAAAVVAKRENSGDRKTIEKNEEKPPCDPSSAERKGRAAADALNRQIKEVVSTGSSYRNEYKAYKDVKPPKSFKVSTQYKPPEEEANRETSYSATYRGEQSKTLPADNKLMERRRIRSLYNEPSKEAPKVDKPASRSKPKKTPTTTTGRMLKKSKEKQVAGALPAKKKSSGNSGGGLLAPKPEGGVTKKSKELSNRLAEAKQ